MTEVSKALLKSISKHLMYLLDSNSWGCHSARPVLLTLLFYHSLREEHDAVLREGLSAIGNTHIRNTMGASQHSHKGWLAGDSACYVTGTTCLLAICYGYEFLNRVGQIQRKYLCLACWQGNFHYKQRSCWWSYWEWIDWRSQMEMKRWHQQPINQSIIIATVLAWERAPDSAAQPTDMYCNQ